MHKATSFLCVAGRRLCQGLAVAENMPKEPVLWSFGLLRVSGQRVGGHSSEAEGNSASTKTRLALWGRSGAEFLRYVGSNVCRCARPAWVRPESAICTEVSTLDTTEIARNGTEAAAQLLPSMQGSHPRNLLQEGVCCKGHEYKDGGYFSIFQLPGKDLVVDDAASMVVLLFVAVLVLWEIENPTGSQISKIIDVDCENG